MPQDYYGTIKAGSKGVSLVVVLRLFVNNREATGKLASDITVQYYRQGNVPVDVPIVDLISVEKIHTPGGWIEVSPSFGNAVYRLDIPDAAIATGSDFVLVSVKSLGCFIFNERYNLQ